MQSFYIFLPVAMIFCAIAVACYLWAVDNGQFDDLDKEAERILFEDDKDPYV